MPWEELEEEYARHLSDVGCLVSDYQLVIGFTLNIDSNIEISIKQIAKIILEMIEAPSSRIEYTKNRPGDVFRLYADVTAFTRLTNWKPNVSFEEGLQKTIQWFKSRPEGIQSLLTEEKGINWE